MSRKAPSVRSGNAIDAEVANLFKLRNKNNISNALLALRQKYHDDDLINKIQDVFIRRHSSIVKKAKKFSAAIKTKYEQQNIPFHQLLLKARAHAKKHGFSDAEFAEFQRIYEQELAGKNSNEVVIPLTNLMKVLGNITAGHDMPGFNVGDADYANVQSILKLHEVSKALHSQVLYQSMLFDEIDATMMQASANTTISMALNSPSDHVHPILAAMFLPKFAVFDNHFLRANMAGIVKDRFNNQPLNNIQDYELFYNLVTDPNDVICDNRTPVADLLHRCNLQNQLWNSVLHLRNGQFYNASLREFVTAIDVCRLNKYDNPDLVYGRNDGTIIKRLFSAFSFRPTVVATLPNVSMFAYNPYSQNIRPTITAIPMINIRLTNGLVNTTAPGVFGSTATSVPGAIFQNSLKFPQTFIEGNTIVNRQTDVMYSNEVIVFYVDRRSYNLTMRSTITRMTRLPTAAGGVEQMHEEDLFGGDARQLTDLCKCKVDSTDYQLRSVVVAQTHKAKTTDPSNPQPITYVIGSHTLIFDRNDASLNTVYKYDPMHTVKDRRALVNDVPLRQETDLNKIELDVRKTGTIFIFQNSKTIKDDLKEQQDADAEEMNRSLSIKPFTPSSLPEPVRVPVRIPPRDRSRLAAIAAERAAARAAERGVASPTAIMGRSVEPLRRVEPLREPNSFRSIVRQAQPPPQAYQPGGYDLLNKYYQL